jgi:regulator of sigma E protease
MITVIAGIVMLGILVFIHELGHFCVAKLCGVKVLKFSLGFGPRLVSRTWGETEYMICAVPLGGYVQMLGEGGGEQGESAASQLSPEERKRSFDAQPVGRRTAIIAAGPAMNLLLPFLILPITFLVGVNLPAFFESPACVGYVVAESEGGRAGFMAGDCVVALNTNEIAHWSDANRELITNIGAPLNFTVERGAERLVLTIPAEEGSLEGLQSLGLLPWQEPIIGMVAPGMPAQKAGMEVEDRIVAIEGEAVDSWYDLRRLIQKRGGEAQTFTVERNGRLIDLSVKPVIEERNGTDYLVGVAPLQETVLKRFGPAESIRAGAERTVELVKLTIVFIQKLFAGHVSTDNIGGPITVVQIAGQAAQTDVAAILTVLAFLSIQLGILNLLPIPILDGGHLFFNLYEVIARRPMSIRAREIAQQIGLMLILMLMVLAFYNDIVRLFVGMQ